MRVDILKSLPFVVCGAILSVGFGIYMDMFSANGRNNRHDSVGVMLGKRSNRSSTFKNTSNAMGMISIEEEKQQLRQNSNDSASLLKFSGAAASRRNRRSNKTLAMKTKHSNHRAKKDNLVQTATTTMSTSILIPNETDTRGIQQIRESIILSPSNRNELSPLDTCSPTAQVQLIMTDNSNHNDTKNWILQALDEHGQPKTVGGDEFYVTYRDYGMGPSYDNAYRDPSAVAVIKDLANGQYELQFSESPYVQPVRIEAKANAPYIYTGFGKLTIFFQYTCGIGRMLRPSKDSWKNGGMMRQTHFYHNISMPPNIRKFQNPNNLDRNGAGVVRIDLSTYKSVICFGDSIVNNFCGKVMGGFAFKQGNIICEGNIGSEMSSQTVDMLLDKLHDWHSEQLLPSNQSGSTSNHSSNNNTALLLGSAVWDVLEPTNRRKAFNLDDHIQACRDFIESVRKRYPSVTVYWKSPSAFHVQALQPDCFQKPKCVQRTVYMSSSLAELLYDGQKQLMNELRVPLLDVYEGFYLSAAWLVTGDGRHYRTWINKLILDYFYK